MLKAVKLIKITNIFKIKLLYLLLLVILLFFSIVSNAQASNCYQFGADKVCILKIKRSAKYYWRYRIELSVNDTKKPLTVYDCRQQKVINNDGSMVSFSDKRVNGVGEREIGNFICKTLNK